MGSDTVRGNLEQVDFSGTISGCILVKVINTAVFKEVPLVMPSISEIKGMIIGACVSLASKLLTLEIISCACACSKDIGICDIEGFGSGNRLSACEVYVARAFQSIEVGSIEDMVFQLSACFRFEFLYCAFDMIRYRHCSSSPNRFPFPFLLSTCPMKAPNALPFRLCR